QRHRAREGERHAGAALHDPGPLGRADPGQADPLPRADLPRVLHDSRPDAHRLRRADPRARHHALDAELAVRVLLPGPGAVHLDARQHARGGGADGDGDDDAVDLPVGLRLPARLDAALLLVRGPDLPDDVADRRGPRRDPARRGLGGAVGALGGAVGDGHRRLRAGDVQVPQAAGITLWVKIPILTIHCQDWNL